MPDLVKIKQYWPLFFFILSIQASIAQEGLIITEIMAHPAQTGALAAEYIEIYNNGTTPIPLTQIRLQVATSSIPLGNRLIRPKQYVILTAAQHEALFHRYGQVVGLPTWRILNNQGAEVSLINQHGERLDQVAYRRNWYGSTAKSNGGWSLERINPHLPCNNQSTWTASSSAQGGTPGQQNAVWDEHFRPEWNIRLLDVRADRIRLQMESEQQSLHIPSENSFRIQRGTSR